MAQQTGQKIAGVIENMSWLELPTGERMELFGKGGGCTLAGRLSETLALDVPLLGSIPLEVSLREGGDNGYPIVSAGVTTVAGAELALIARNLAQRPRGLSQLKLRVSPKNS